MLQGESHVSRGPILLLGNSICPMSRFAERPHKSEKKKHNITPRIVSLDRLWFIRSFIPSFIFDFLYSDVDECQTRPCQNGGNCENNDGAYTCNYDAGYGEKHSEEG